MQREGILVVDKSALQCLSRNEARWLGFSFMLNLPPILVLEILADLSKGADRVTSEKSVVQLAQKFGGSGGGVNADFRKLCATNLLGEEVAMAGQVVVDHGGIVRDADGSTGLIVDLAPANIAILKWASGKFSDFEHRTSKQWRDDTAGLRLATFEDFLRGRSVRIQRPQTDQQLSAIVESVLDTESLQEPLLLYFIDEIGLPQNLKLQIRRRWSQSSVRFVRSFAPYVYFCLKALLHVLILWKHKLTKLEPNNLRDVQYLYYLPFCTAFSSRDKLHRKIVPLLKRPGQEFIWGDDLKSKMKAVDNIYGPRVEAARASVGE